jgi:AsmA protein
MKKKVLIALAVAVVVVVVLLIALPFLIDANQFKPTIESNLSSALGRTVEIGNIQLAILSGGIRVDGVSIADDPAFSRSPFLKAKELTAGVALIPLIFSKKIEVSSFTVTDPQVSLLHSPSGTWNFSSLGPKESKSSPRSGAPADFTVGKLKISNGTMIVGTVSGGKQQTYQDVNLEASDLTYTSQFPFSLTAKTPESGSVAVEGKAGPIDPQDASLTPFEATINVKHLDLASTGFVDASSGLAGMIDFRGDLASDGRQIKSKGTVQAEKIKLAAGGSPSTVPINVDYSTAYDLKRQTGDVTQGDLHIGKAQAHLTGNYDTSHTSTTLRMKLTGQAMPAPDVQGALPAIGITLPSGASLQGGALDVALTMDGPVDKLVIAGPVNLSNAKLKGFNLKSKLGALSSFTGLGGGGGDTDIQTLSGNLRVDPVGTHLDNLNVVAPSIGTITGNANISPAGQLNCKMAAKLAASSSPAGALTSTLSSLTGRAAAAPGGTIPFTVTGTPSNPLFLPDIAGMAGGLVKGAAGTSTSPADAASGILGLFQKKKSP